MQPPCTTKQDVANYQKTSTVFHKQQFNLIHIQYTAHYIKLLSHHVTSPLQPFCSFPFTWWQFGIAVMVFIVSMKLLYIGHG